MTSILFRNKSLNFESKMSSRRFYKKTNVRRLTLLRIVTTLEVKKSKFVRSFFGESTARRFVYDFNLSLTETVHCSWLYGILRNSVKLFNLFHPNVIANRCIFLPWLDKLKSCKTVFLQNSLQKFDKNAIDKVNKYRFCTANKKSHFFDR